MTFSQAIEKACLISDKPILAIAPVCDKELFSMLPGLAHMTRPLLIGNSQTIQEGLLDNGLDPKDFEICHEPDEKTAILQAMHLIKEKKAHILMEAGFEHDLFMQEAFRAFHRRGALSIPSHVSIVESLSNGKCALITDALMNSSPSLKEKIAILNNALSLARLLEETQPKVAALSAIEYVNPSIPSTLEAAILSKMSQRGQFGNALVDGPLDIDCAVSKDACDRKGVKSDVAGDVDIFLVPDVEAGSCFVQFLYFFGNMHITGLVLGLPVPVIQKSIFNGSIDVIAGVAFASLMVQR
jgi:phosphate butyryltransferase